MRVRYEHEDMVEDPTSDQARDVALSTRLLDSDRAAARSGYCDLFVALARAAGIPARAVEGFATEVGASHHHWVEVLLPRRGWRVIDPWAIEAGEASVGRHRGLRVPLSFRTRDPRLGGYLICYLHGAEDTQLELTSVLFDAGDGRQAA